MDIDIDLVRELRVLAERGVAPSRLLAVIGERLGATNTNFRLIAIAYFREAFGVSLADAARIGAAKIFPGGGRTAAEVDSEMLPLIERARHFWAAR